MRYAAITLFCLVLVAVPLCADVSIDTQVSGDSQSAASSIVSPAISTNSGNELLLAFVSTDALSSKMTVTGVTGGGLTWSLVFVRTRNLVPRRYGEHSRVAPLTNATVTASLSQKVLASISVISFSGVDTTGSNGAGAIGAVTSASASSGAPTASLTTTRNGSWVFGVGNDYDNAIGRTVGPNQTLVHQFLSPLGDTYWMQRQNSPTIAAGTAVKINDTAPTGDRFNLSICEVLPSAITGPDIDPACCFHYVSTKQCSCHGYDWSDRERDG